MLFRSFQPTHLICNDDDGSSRQSAIYSYPVFTGVNYRIKISRYGVGLGGNLQLHLDYTPTVPANDNCNAAFAIATPAYSFSQDIFYASKASCENYSSCVATEPTNNHSVWYSYVPTEDGTVSVDTYGSTYDTVLTAYNGCAFFYSGTFPICLRSTSIACNDDAGGTLQSGIFDMPVTGGTHYLFRVTSYGATLPSGSSLTFDLSFTPNSVPCPADFNQDGGVDGSDVVAFYAAWESGDPSADVNQDGGIDGGDVDTFAAL